MEQSATWYLADTPERDPANDAFGHADIADNLLTMIRGAKKERLLIGLLGGFGVGKSTIIELLKGKLQGDKELTVVRISAERHEVGGFHRSLVFAFAEELVESGAVKKDVAEEHLLGLEYSTAQAMSDFSSSPAARLARRFARVDALRTLRKIGLWVLGVFLLAAVLAVAIWFLGGEPRAFINSGTASLLLAIATLGSIVQSLWQVAKPEKAIASVFKPGTLTRSRPRVEAADEFERAFGRLAELAKGRLVIAVDDIDRLSPDEVLAGLNSIRSFQLTCRASKRPIFIVSADERVIATAIRTSEPGLASVESGSDETAMAYLNRLFVQRQYVPPHGLSDIQGFAMGLLRRSNHQGLTRLGSEINDVLTVLIHDGVHDPRHVVRLLNAFFGDLRLVLQREKRDGIRSITEGELSKRPKTLARMVALKVDFPRFYDQLQVDLDLLRAVEKSVAGSADESDLRRIEDAGWALKSEDYQRLAAYVGRTAGWVETSVDLLPYIYLGQDEIDRDLGSRDARQARSLLANAQIAELRNVLGAVTPPRLSTFAKLMIESLVRLPPHELGNALKTAVAVADQIPAKDCPALADVIAATLPRANGILLDFDKLITLAVHATQPHLRMALFDKILAPLSEEEADSASARDLIVLARREDLAELGGHERVLGHLEDAIRALGASADAAALETWLAPLESAENTDLAAVTAEAVLGVISHLENEPGRAWLQSALVQFGRVPDADSASLLDSIIPLMRAGLGGDLGEFLTSAAAELTVTEATILAKLPGALKVGLLGKNGTHLDEESHLRTEVASIILLRSSLDVAVSYVSGKIPIARFASDLLANLLKARDEHYASVDVMKTVERILEAHPSEITPIALQLAQTLGKPQEDLPAGFVDLLDEVLKRLDDIGDEAADNLRSAFSGRLQPEIAPVIRMKTFPMLGVAFATETGTIWVDALVKDQLPYLTYNSVAQAEIATEALSGIFGMAEASNSTAQTVIQQYTGMTAYGQAPAATIVAKAMCQIPWPDDVSQKLALNLLDAQRNYLDEGAHGMLVDQLAHRLPTEVPAGLRTVLTTAMKTEAQSTNSMRRKNVASLWPLIDPVDAAIVTAYCDADGLAAPQIFAEHPNLIKQFVTKFAHEFDTATAKMVGGVSVLSAAYTANPEQYEGRVFLLIEEQLARDSSLGSNTWGTLLSPFSEKALDQIAQLLQNAWTSAEADAKASLTVIGAISDKPGFDAVLAPYVGRTMERWISTELNVDVSSALAREFRKGASCRNQVLSKFGPHGPRKNNPSRAAYDAARQALAPAG